MGPCDQVRFVVGGSFALGSGDGWMGDGGTEKPWLAWAMKGNLRDLMLWALLAWSLLGVEELKMTYFV